MIQIISADDVKFEVESFHLQSASLFFRDLFADGNLKSGEEPILIDAPADVVGIFVATVSQTYKYDYKTPFTVESVDTLLQLSERYSCDIVKQCLRLDLINNHSEIPWMRLFFFAARMDGVELAKVAIAGMGSFGPSTYANVRQEMLTQPNAQVDHRYIDAYVRAGVESWVEIAEKHEFAERKLRDRWTDPTRPSGADVAAHFKL